MTDRKVETSEEFALIVRKAIRGEFTIRQQEDILCFKVLERAFFDLKSEKQKEKREAILFLTQKPSTPPKPYSYPWWCEQLNIDCEVLTAEVNTYLLTLKHQPYSLPDTCETACPPSPLSEIALRILVR